MINIEETLAALDAAASISSLPVMCTMTVEADGSIFSGGNAVEAAIALEGAGAAAVGINEFDQSFGDTGFCHDVSDDQRRRTYLR